MRLTQKTRGAALMEYGFLVGLISAAAILSVSSIGTKVSEGFQVSSEAMASDANPAGVPDMAPSPWGDPLPTGEFTTWRVAIDNSRTGDGEMPGHITNPGNAWYWIVDLEQVMQNKPVGTTLYWDATYRTSGRVTPRNEYSNGFLNYGIESFWERPGTDYAILRGEATPLTPPTDEIGVTTEYVYDDSATRGVVPADATGIRLDRSFYACGFQSTCVLDPVQFDIRIYAE